MVPTGGGEPEPGRAGRERRQAVGCECPALAGATSPVKERQETVRVLQQWLKVGGGRESRDTRALPWQLRTRRRRQGALHSGDVSQASSRFELTPALYSAASNRALSRRSWLYQRLEARDTSKPRSRGRDPLSLRRADRSLDHLVPGLRTKWTFSEWGGGRSERRRAYRKGSGTQRPPNPHSSSGTYL